MRKESLEFKSENSLLGDLRKGSDSYRDIFYTVVCFEPLFSMKSSQNWLVVERH